MLSFTSYLLNSTPFPRNTLPNSTYPWSVQKQLDPKVERLVRQLLVRLVCCKNLAFSLPTYKTLSQSHKKTSTCTGASATTCPWTDLRSHTHSHVHTHSHTHTLTYTHPPPPPPQLIIIIIMYKMFKHFQG